MGFATYFLFSVALLLPSHVDLSEIRDTLARQLDLFERARPAASGGYAPAVRALLAPLG